MKFSSLLLFITCFSTPTICQDNYLIDSIRNVKFFVFFNNTTEYHEKYFYNDHDILIRKNTKFYNSKYSYGADYIQEDRYENNVDSNLIYRVITTINNDRFPILIKEYNKVNENWIYSSLDSMIRDANNNITESYSYLINHVPGADPLRPLLETKQKFENNNLIEKREQHYDIITASPTALITDIYEYNDNNQLVSHLKENVQFEFLNESIETNFFYKNGLLDYETRIEFNSGIHREFRKNYIYDDPYMTINHHYIFDYSDIHVESEHYKRSSSSFFDYDSMAVYRFFLTDTVLTSEKNYHEKISPEKDSAEIQFLNKNFHFNEGNLVSFEFEKSIFILKNNLPPKEILESIFIYPNPINSGGNLIINTPTAAYNTLVIYNGNGQLVYERSVDYSEQIMLVNPIHVPGIYFVRLQLDNQVVSNWAKLMVH